MKIVVVSDSHGESGCLDKIIEMESPFEYLIHCGDGFPDLDNILLPEKSSCIFVQGNMDPNKFGTIRNFWTGEISGMKFMVTHGHYFYVKSGLSEIRSAGIENGADVVLFGHTHQRYLKIDDEIILFNPGPCMNGSYGIINIDKTAEFLHKQINC